MNVQSPPLQKGGVANSESVCSGYKEQRVFSNSGEAEEPVPPPPERAALRRRWANLIRRVYETDPLVCPRCGAEMRVIGFITEPGVIKRILDHLRKRDRVSRPPPPLHSAVASIA